MIGEEFVRAALFIQIHGYFTFVNTFEKLEQFISICINACSFYAGVPEAVVSVQLGCS